MAFTCRVLSFNQGFSIWQFVIVLLEGVRGGFGVKFFLLGFGARGFRLQSLEKDNALNCHCT